MLGDFGGTILPEHDVRESFSGDGLIAAYFRRDPLQWKEPPTGGQVLHQLVPGAAVCRWNPIDLRPLLVLETGRYVT